jgi:hypothetical protein
MSIFRLERAAETGGELSWKLLNGTRQRVWSAAGPWLRRELLSVVPSLYGLLQVNYV